MGRLTGGEIVAEYLIKEKVPYIIGIPGHGCLGLVDAFIGRENKIKMLDVKQEMAGVHMADGYFRVSGKPLAVYTSIGPGAINTAIGIATCYVDSTPVIVFTGDAHTYMRGKGLLQEIERAQDSNFARILEPITKRYWVVTEVCQLPSILHRAFNQMMTGRKGPVIISLPMNVQSDSAEVEIPDPTHHKPDGVPQADSMELKKASILLMKAKRPVILAGGGVRFAEAWDELRKAAEFTNSAVVQTFQGKDVFPADHQLYGLLTGSKGTTCGLKLCREADIILAVGTRFADETTCSYKHGESFNIPPTKLIHIDIDGQEIGKNYPVEIGIVADAKAALSGLLLTLSENYKPKNWKNSSYTKLITKYHQEWYEHLKKWEDRKKEPMMITSLLREVREFLPKDAIVCSSSGNTQAQILQEFDFYYPRTNITTGGFSTMGWGFPAAMGAKLAAPYKQVVAIVGDGDFMMTMQELSTAVQHNIQVVVIIANNLGWQAIKDLQIAALGENRDINVEWKQKDGTPYSPNFAEVAKAFDCYGERITKCDEVKPALERAFKSGKPAVIEAMTQTQYPYTGSPAVGWWDVPIPTYLKKRRLNYERAREKERL